MELEASVIFLCPLNVRYPQASKPLEMIAKLPAYHRVMGICESVQGGTGFSPESSPPSTYFYLVLGDSGEAR